MVNHCTRLLGLLQEDGQPGEFTMLTMKKPNELGHRMEFDPATVARGDVTSRNCGIYSTSHQAEIARSMCAPPLNAYCLAACDDMLLRLALHRHACVSPAP